MEKFSIKRVTEVYKPDLDELAKALFPTVTYPKLAFNRILKGEANLDSTQISILASYLGVSVSELFTIDDSGWHMSSCTGDSRLIFTKGDYKATLYGNSLTILKCDKCIAALTFLVNKEAMSLEDFIKLLDEEITDNN